MCMRFHVYSDIRDRRDKSKSICVLKIHTQTQIENDTRARLAYIIFRLNNDNKMNFLSFYCSIPKIKLTSPVIYTFCATIQLNNFRFAFRLHSISILIISAEFIPFIVIVCMLLKYFLVKSLLTLMYKHNWCMLMPSNNILNPIVTINCYVENWQINIWNYEKNSKIECV